MSNPREQVILEYARLADGDIVSGETCPACAGGRSKEGSLSVGRKQQWLWWRCHRDSCRFRGSYTHQRVGPKAIVNKELNKLTYSRTDLPINLSRELQRRFGLNEGLISKAQWQWTSSYGGRVVMPILSLDGELVGDNLRNYSGDEPKTLINKLREGPALCWYPSVKYPSIAVICEDQPSALRISKEIGMVGVALMGTDLSYEKATEIKSSGIKHLAISLDNDATATAVKHVVNYRHMLPGLTLVPLNKDIKNMNEKEFAIYVEQLRKLQRV